MFVIRTLLIAIAVLLLCLLILPKTKTSEKLENKTFKILISLFIGLIILFLISLYQFKDQLWHDDGNLEILYKKILVIENNKKSISLTKYDFANLNPHLIVSELQKISDLHTIRITELNPEQINFITQIINNNKSINIILVNNISEKSLNNLLNNINSRNNLEIKFRNVNFNDNQIKVLKSKNFKYYLPD